MAISIVSLLREKPMMPGHHSRGNHPLDPAAPAAHLNNPLHVRIGNGLMTSGRESRLGNR